MDCWVTVKIKFFVHAKEACGGGKVYVHELTSSPNGDDWSIWCPGRFTPGESVPITHWRGRLDGHQTQAGGFGKQQNLFSLPRIEPPRFLGSPAYSLVIALTMLSRLYCPKGTEETRKMRQDRNVHDRSWTYSLPNMKQGTDTQLKCSASLAYVTSVLETVGVFCYTT